MTSVGSAPAAGQLDRSVPPSPERPPAAAAWSPAPAAHPRAAIAGHDGRLLDRRAGILVVAAIGLGGVMQLVGLALSHVSSIETDALIRYDIVLTVGFYAFVAVMIVSQITPSVRLRWGDGPVGVRIASGAAVGVGISLVLLALVSAAAGHLQSDPRIVLLMSEGDPTHIIVMVFIGCVAAPLVEETLFRGLLLESLRPRGQTVAIVVSAAAFAVWHFMPTALIYYAALGATLGWLYIKRGLVASIAAHVGFNAVLTIAAISIVLGPSHTFQVGGLSFTAPSGWSRDTSPAAEFSGAAAVLIGPDDAQLEVIKGPAETQSDTSAVVARLRSGKLPFGPGITLDVNTISELPSPAGEVVEAGIAVDDRQGTLALLAADGQSYGLVFLSAGSDKAQADFDKMIGSLQVE
jgi:membrane protease YdiL (CAAX protease family)